MLLVDGLCRLLWRPLLAGQFEYLANCDERGVSTTGRAQLLAALQDAVRSQVRTGWLLLALAMAVNVPWVLAAQYVGDHLSQLQQPG